MEKASTHFLRLAGRILATAAGIALVVLLMGYFLHWDNPVKYSNAFFWSGAILIIIGVFSVTGGFEQRGDFGMTYAQTAGDANIAERNQRMATDIAQRYGTMIFLVITGLLLIGVAIAIGQFLVS
ncbi:MAG: hypothetical protein ACM3Y8_01315 [Byssovorax cruenta]